MVGRGALGRPWVFKQIAHYLRTGENLPEPTRAERAEIALKHARLTLETTHMPDKRAIYELRGQLSRYKLDEPGSVKVRNRIVHIESYAELEAILLPIMGLTYRD